MIGGLLCVELAALGQKLKKPREALRSSPYVYALFRSPPGDGLCAIFQISPDKARQRDPFRAVEAHVLWLTGIQISKTAMFVDTLAFHDAGILVNGTLIQFEQ